MPIIELPTITYEDVEKDPRRMVDKINDTFRQLDWLLNQGRLDTQNINQTVIQIQPVDAAIGGDTYLEYGSADWNPNGVEFILVNGYLEQPVVATAIQGDPAQFGSASFVLVVKHVQETIDGQLCYSKVQVYPKGASVPSLTGAKITMQAVCNKAVKRS